MNEKKRALLTKIFGEKLAAQVIADAEEGTKQLEAAGIRYKTTASDPARPYVDDLRTGRVIRN